MKFTVRVGEEKQQRHTQREGDGGGERRGERREQTETEEREGGRDGLTLGAVHHLPLHALEHGVEILKLRRRGERR